MMNTYKKQQGRNSEQGIVSLIVVIFTAILLSIVTISFVTLMTKDQQQATNSDLSQSAYDSAQAGVEDAKRLLIANQNCRSNGGGSGCSSIAAALRANKCSTLADSGIVGDNGGETLLQQNDGDEKLDQAYTCVKIKTDTRDYLGQINKDESVVVPLRGESGFNKIRLQWFSDKDISSDAADKSLIYPPVVADLKLPRSADWPGNTPAIMRTQVIQTADKFTLSDLDDNKSGSSSNTLFLHPEAIGLRTANMKRFGRKSPQEPLRIKCRDELTSGGYACEATITLASPNPEGLDAFLHLTSLYNKSHFKVELLENSDVVPFQNVQPEVDSTGRANDLFRRVVSRIELTGGFTYPNAAVDLKGNLCKNFFVTDKKFDNQASEACEP